MRELQQLRKFNREGYTRMDNDVISTPHALDCKGLYCPEPVMLLHTKVRELQPGDVLRVTATDPSTERDIPKFCQFLGHELMLKQTEDEIFDYWIRVGGVKGVD